MDCLGTNGHLRSFVSAFLMGRMFQVRLGQVLGEPRGIPSAVPQGSLLSPWLFELALAGLVAVHPLDPSFPVHCSMRATWRCDCEVPSVA